MRVYTVPLLASSIPATNAFDLFEFTPADDKAIALLGLTIDNVGIAADAGDAQEELLAVSIYRGFTTSGSGGASATPAPVQRNDASAGFTAEAGNTTVATTSGVAIVPFGWNIRVPCREFWPVELCPTASQADTTLVVRIAAGGADAISINACAWVAELV